ncbi:MAG: OpgC domain-containing protein [Pseudomonadota bacterium]
MTETKKRARDLRLDFFRGLAMFIILLAHTPGNAWTLWIPARFGFSDATEIFVFCSGFASALAFGAVFARAGWWIGTVRIGFRIWQVYWAQIGMVLATALLLFSIDASGWGEDGRTYIARLPIVPLFENTGAALAGLATLTWVPNYFDILPMYLVILAMIPAVMLVYRHLGKEAVFVLLVALWLAAQFKLLEMPSRPWRPEIPWFFNPFGWQLVFFTGFAFAMGWLPRPPVKRWLVWAAATYVVLVIPFAWFRIYGGQYLPDEWLLQDLIADTRQEVRFLWWKSWVGAARYLHFLALAYLAWVAVGAGGIRLTTGWRAPGKPRAWVQWAAAAALVLSAPYSWIAEIAAVSPALDAAILHHFTVTATAWLGGDLLITGPEIGVVQLVHLGALALLVWSAIGPRARSFATGPGFRRMVPVIRKVGTQSLAVFIVSMVLAQFNGFMLDVLGRSSLTWAAVNLWGFAVLIGVAYGVGWIKNQPWRVQRTDGPPSPQSLGTRLPAE